jgi:hypothetical protein
VGLLRRLVRLERPDLRERLGLPELASQGQLESRALPAVLGRPERLGLARLERLGFRERLALAPEQQEQPGLRDRPEPPEQPVQASLVPRGLLGRPVRPVLPEPPAPAPWERPGRLERVEQPAQRGLWVRPEPPEQELRVRLAQLLPCRLTRPPPTRLRTFSSRPLSLHHLEW